MNGLDELLALLDRQIVLLRQKVSLMRSIAQCVRRQDVSGLRALLEGEIELETVGDGLSGRIQALREHLAAHLRLPPEQVTLGRLAQSIDGPDGIALSDRRERLLTLVEELHNESAAAARLARFAFEFDQELLLMLTGTRESNPVYAADCSVAEHGEFATFERSV